MAMKHTMPALLLACLAMAHLAAAANTFNFRVNMDGKLDKVNTAASGFVTGQVDMDKKTVSGQISMRNIKDVTMAHFHIGAAGTDGPVIAWLWPTDNKAPAKQTFSVGHDFWSVAFTLTEKDLAYSNSSTPAVTDFKSFADAIMAGDIYANVHTVKNPAGEIRGQTALPGSSFRFDMTGRLDNVTTRANGYVQGDIDSKNEVLTGTMAVRNIKGVTMAHLHIGAAGTDGPVAAWLWPTDTKAPTKQPFNQGHDYWMVSFTIKASDLTPSNSSTPPVTDFSSLLKAMAKGEIYANVHTVRNPAGEIRGQSRLV